MRAERLATTIRQEQFAQAALGLIVSHGVRGLSIAAVARRVGLTPSAIYRHFASKDHLLDAILDLLEKRLLGNLDHARQRGADPLEALGRAVRRHVDLIRENQAIPRIIFSEDIYSGRPERKARVHSIINRYLDGLAQMVREGQKGRLIRSDIDPKTLSLMILGLIQPAGLLWFLTDGGFDVTRQVEMAWRIMSQMIAPGQQTQRKAAPRSKSKTRRGASRGG